MDILMTLISAMISIMFMIVRYSFKLLWLLTRSLLRLCGVR